MAIKPKHTKYIFQLHTFSTEHLSKLTASCGHPPLVLPSSLLEQSSQHMEHFTSEELTSVKLDSSAIFCILSVFLVPLPPSSKEVLESPFQKLVFVFTLYVGEPEPCSSTLISELHGIPYDSPAFKVLFRSRCR